jgi:hypothetical protein
MSDHGFRWIARTDLSDNLNLQRIPAGQDLLKTRFGQQRAIKNAPNQALGSRGPFHPASGSSHSLPSRGCWEDTLQKATDFRGESEEARPYPLYPRMRTFVSAILMSALCHKQISPRRALHRDQQDSGRHAGQRRHKNDLRINGNIRPHDRPRKSSGRR